MVGLPAPSIVDLTALGPDTFLVTASTGTGSGTLGLDLIDNDSILDASGNPLGGAGAGNGNFRGDVYTIDRVEPDTTITSNPPETTTSTSASFSFISTEANGTFECSLDGAPFTPCATPQSYKLASGSHVFQVRAIDTIGNAELTPASYTWTIETDSQSPGDRMYWGDIGTHKIQSSKLDGTDVVDLITDLDSPSSIALDPAGGKIYWAEEGTFPKKIQRANLDGSGVEDLILLGQTDPRSVRLDPSGGKLYWSNDTVGSVQRANLDGTDVATIITGLTSPTGTALDLKHSKVYWINFPAGMRKIQRANLDGSSVEDVITGSFVPFNLAVDEVNDQIYWTELVSKKIQRANLDGSSVQDVITGLNLPESVALDLSAGKIYWSDEGAATIQRANLDGSMVEDLITSGLITPTGIALQITPPTDSEAPDTTITSNPPGLTNSTTATFGFIATETGSRFACSLDNGGFTSCTSPQTYSGLSDGTHTFQVKATDAANNSDPTPASFNWAIDVTPPETTITSGPPAVSNLSEQRFANFTFTSSEAASTFECSLDGGGFIPCVSPKLYTQVADGSHVFQARATDAAGNIDTTPASYAWTLDSVPPETLITSNPPALTNSTSATFSFTSDEPEALLDVVLTEFLLQPRHVHRLKTMPVYQWELTHFL